MMVWALAAFCSNKHFTVQQQIQLILEVCLSSHKAAKL